MPLSLFFSLISEVMLCFPLPVMLAGSLYVIALTTKSTTRKRYSFPRKYSSTITLSECWKASFMALVRIVCVLMLVETAIPWSVSKGFTTSGNLSDFKSYCWDCLFIIIALAWFIPPSKNLFSRFIGISWQCFQYGARRHWEISHSNRSSIVYSVGHCS